MDGHRDGCTDREHGPPSPTELGRGQKYILDLQITICEHMLKMSTFG